MSEMLMPGLVLLGVVVGGLMVWLLSRSHMRSQVDAAVARSDAAAQAELAQLRERVRASDETKATDRAAYDALKREADSLRNDLDEERDQTAKLSERGTRVPALEQENLRLGEELRLSGAEMLRVSSDAAQKSQAVTSLSGRVSDLEEVNRRLGEKLEHASDALTVAAERKATLEEQTARIPGLERDLSTAMAEIDRVAAQLTELRETAGAETARLVAERSAHSLVREELAEAKSALEASDALVRRLNTQLTELREASGGESARLAGEREAHGLVRAELVLEKSARESADAEVGRLNGELTELRTRLEAEREGAEERLTLLMNAKEALTDQFKALATDILEEKSKRFAEQNHATLGQLLDPLRTQLNEFKGKVEEVYVQESNGRAALSEQVKSLVSLNQTLSQDAKNLTLALKGQAKTQGNWGELILERVLEASGLKKGHEYKVQDSQVREDGTRAQPDVVIELPEQRKLVVDAKVSLVAYDRYVSADADEERAVALREHLSSVRGHIKGLSEKKYHALYGLQSLDFVLAFVPIEPAFMLAVTNDSDLFMDAWQRNVLLVSPSTLLFVVRTVAHLWRQEAQSRNSQEIAERGAALYDKLSGFVTDLQKVGDRLRSAKEAFDDAQAKLSTGKGNVIRQAEMLRELGVKPTKALPSPLVQASTSHDDIVVPGLEAVTAPLVKGAADGLSEPLPRQ